MTNKNIERLKTKIGKDPLSKLFVPLAEEYKKIGMVDEAINILLTALENQPYYKSAMVALGKMYLHKGMLTEAMEEFEKVVGLIPDNLLAHKKLADIYYKQENFDRAVKECTIILELNPNDEEAKTMKSSLESRVPQSKVREKEAEEITPDSHLGGFQVTGNSDEQGASSDSEEIKKPQVYEIYEEVSGAELGIEIPEKFTPVEEGFVSQELKEFRKIVAQYAEESSAEEKLQKQDEKKVKPVQASEDGISISMPTKTMADIYIGQGLYDKAMDVYREILSSDPENKQIIQKCEKLRMLMESKDKD
jgi:tetratricopeptide (TPR) repeat protein